ncbi:MAG: enoyl-CoA hydratase [Gammaproteobacteria bacterium]|nr:enoyl-CoA hydratase [Gammaproteobacteria bacterium]
MTEAQQVIVSIEQGILSIELNRPDKKNALTNDMYKIINEALVKAKTDEGIHVVLFAGKGDCFTAGNDIADFLDSDIAFEKKEVVRLLRILTNFEKPIVAGVHGSTIGIGTTILLHCDIVVAAKETKFALPFVPLGLCPEAASSLLLPNLVGHHQAAELLLLGEAFNTEKAEKLGLINRVVETREVRLQAMALCQKLTSLPVNALLQTKRLLKSAPNTVEERISQELDVFGKLLQSKEAKAIFQAFLNKC